MFRLFSLQEILMIIQSDEWKVQQIVHASPQSAQHFN